MPSTGNKRTEVNLSVSQLDEFALGFCSTVSYSHITVFTDSTEIYSTVVRL